MSIPVIGLIIGLASAAFADELIFTSVNDPLGLGDPGNVAEFVSGINNAGQMVGAYLAGSGSDGSENFTGFLYSGGTFTPINDPSAEDTQPTGINGSGQIVGSIINNNTDPEYGFLYSGGAFTSTTISDPSGIETYVNGINASGQIVGSWASSITVLRVPGQRRDFYHL